MLVIFLTLFTLEERGGGGRNLPELTLNADISITVTAMTLKFYEFQFVAMTTKV